MSQMAGCTTRWGHRPISAAEIAAGSDQAATAQSQCPLPCSWGKPSSQATGANPALATRTPRLARNWSVK